MKKVTKSLLTGVVALGLLAPIATQAVSNNPQITAHAKRRHRRYHRTRRTSHRNYLPKRFWGSWYSRKPIDATYGKKVGTVRAYFGRKGDYIKSPKYTGYIHPKYWTGGFYGYHQGQLGILHHRTLVFNSETKRGAQAAWYLHRV